MKFSLQSLNPNESDFQLASPADILFLSVPDDAIKAVANELSVEMPAMVVHLSGAHSYKILADLESKTAIAQFHPLAALNGDGPIPAGSLCTISASQAWAEEALKKLALALDLIPVSVNPDKAVHYHAAAVLTGNLSLGLVSKSIDLMLETGIDEASARRGLATLLQSVANNLQRHEIKNALTGPIARGDTKVIQSHLEVLEPELKQVYKTLSHWLGFPESPDV
ncbi:MAG: DUF2520 domain-containing protein [Myxococcota bacterium]